MEVVTEYACKLRLMSLNYSWINIDQIENDNEVTKNGYFKKILYFVSRRGAIILGGFDSRRCKYFSPTTRRFSTMRYMTIKGDTQNSTAVWHRGRMFVFPCNIEAEEGSLEIYNPVLGLWSKAARGLPNIIKSSAAASCRNSLFVLGGDNYCAPQWKKSDSIFLLSNDESDDEKLFHWTKLNVRLLRGRVFHAAVAFKGRIWIAGGLLEKRSGDLNNDDLCTR